MGRYRSMRKCEEIGEVAVMNRARSAAARSEVGRKRKVNNSCDEELGRSSGPLVQLKNRRRRLFGSTPPENSTENAASSNSNDPYASCCSSNGSIELENDASKSVDLEEKEEITALGTPTYDDLETRRDRRETTPSSSEVRVEFAEMDSTARPSSLSQANSRRQTPSEKMPSEAELEEFFSTAEKTIHQQFAHKYNFDILKEEPLDGRYEWVRVDP
ncbi:OLC1v1010136C1 [Oldenlandia corymbosa var. corymbosa]|uniref:Cyclin-dependent kinase inhibitor n=1 Tax=Oldenlandia corymbosa var. corymbosa TaxID=529605 RepID=A0AAV1DQM6_OLDCO|nr:OLC1v1010136C1 [Oldenlandia corymbosa var. corymbosa]